jgi:hypothetical protein
MFQSNQQVTANGGDTSADKRRRLGLEEVRKKLTNKRK